MMSERRSNSFPWFRLSRSATLFCLFFALTLSGCNKDWLPHADLAPPYHPAQYVVPASWEGASPFIQAAPSDHELRPDWWKVFKDPILDSLIDQAMEANPDLHAAAERFVQARDMMMMARSRRIPHLGLGGKATRSRNSVDTTLYKDPDTPLTGGLAAGAGLASWEPDFWAAIRNATRVEIHRAQERAAEWGLARLSLQAEIASDYFTLRGFDAQTAIYEKSIDLFRRVVELVRIQYAGALASKLDVARVESLLYSTEAKLAEIQGKRQVTEQSIAILLNLAPASFQIKPVERLHVEKFRVPKTLPSTLLERRPDIAAMERRMAEANKGIGIARAAFFPDVRFTVDGGILDANFTAVDVFKLTAGFWSYGALVSLPVFEGGYRRAQLQKSWSVYRETEDLYRATVLNAFREVENALALTNRLSVAAGHQDEAVGAFLLAQNLTFNLYRGALASSLELIYAQIETLEARITAVEIKVNLLRASVSLLRALGGGWNRTRVPTDDEIQPFKTLEYELHKLEKPPPAKGIDVDADNNWVNNDLTKPSASLPGITPVSLSPSGEP